MKSDLILEIGTEELPPGFIDPALDQLREKGEKLLSRERLSATSFQTYGTPRRLILQVSGLDQQQPDLEEEHLGPAKRIAFDDDGAPTKAGMGFARGKGKTVDDLFIKQTEKGEYVAVVINEPGQPTNQLLPGLLSALIESLTFPKTMRWGTRSLRFARPINWILAVFGDQPVNFSVDGIASGTLTYGHRWINPGPFQVANSADLLKNLAQAQVQFDPVQRRQYILDDLHQTAKQHDAVLIENPALLATVNNLVEIPHAVIGSFNPEFLVLPDEVIITTIEEHQKCFALRQSDGKLLPKFIQISNASPDNDENVRIGSERVISARLADARFYYEEDQKTPLSAKVDVLKNVLFQKDLGTIYEKVMRIQSISAWLATHFGFPKTEVDDCKRAAYLSKADLVTNMIGEKEFTKLQGFMGWKYAAKDGEKPEVARAIFEHYLPRYADDRLPDSPVSAVVSLADKFDTIVGCFGVGIIPTGSQDPYALRRAALGITRIILDRALNLSLGDVTKFALNELESKLTRERGEIARDVGDFFKQRLNNVIMESGIDYDITEAVLASSFDDFVDARKRAQALQSIRQHPNFDSIATANKRVTNILKKVKTLPAVDVDKFEQREERELYSAYLQIREPVLDHIEKHDYAEALDLLVDLREPIDTFFDHVFVMVEDAQIRNNRLAMMKEIKQTFDRIADFSRIVVSSES